MRQRDRLPGHLAIQDRGRWREPQRHRARAEPLSSTDEKFRPVDIKIGPDGAIYFIDWQNPIIGHMQHNLRDPSRDRTHGRVYRVTYEGRPLLEARQDRRRADRANCSICSRSRKTACAIAPGSSSAAATATK